MLWFRLKADYKTHSGKIGTFKAGAPIEVETHFKMEDKSVYVEYKFNKRIFEYFKYFKLSLLSTPDHCVKDRWGNAFCAKKQMFFKANLNFYGDYIAKQLFHCPFCGKKLRYQRPYPKKERLEDYEEDFPPIDDRILESLDIQTGRIKTQTNR